jgi:hypothetical protein
MFEYQRGTPGRRIARHGRDVMHEAAGDFEIG